MPLPTERTEWPPKEHKGTLADIGEWAARYSGEPEALADAAVRAATSQLEQMRYWLRPRQQQTGKRNRLHVLLAGEIATKSADLLFGERVKVTAPPVEGQQVNTSGQDRVDELTDELGLSNNRWLESAEICAALGGVYLRPVWDTDVADHPLLTAVHPDQALPEFRVRPAVGGDVLRGGPPRSRSGVAACRTARTGHHPPRTVRRRRDVAWEA